jgi:hypothetical protein
MRFATRFVMLFLIGLSVACRDETSPQLDRAAAFAMAPLSDSVTITDAPAQLAVGDTAVLRAQAWRGGRVQNSVKLAWLTDSAQVLTVSTNPKGSQATVRGMRRGTAWVFAFDGRIRDSASIVVGTTPPPPPPDTIKPPVDTVPKDTVTPPPPPPTPVTVAELPRVFLNTSLAATPSNGRTLRVNPPGTVQAAIDSALCGDRILVPLGITFSDNHVLRAKGCTASQWITIIADGPLPAEGTRMTKALALSYNLPKLSTPNVGPALATDPGASDYRIVGLEFTGTPQSATTTYNYGFVRLGGEETSLAAMPTDIILDRVYIHGNPVQSQRGVLFNGKRLSLIDSWVSDIYMLGTETQAVGGWGGPGPFKIANNTLDAASMSILFGGAPPAVADVHPSDIEIRRNYMTKSLAAYFGKGYAVKNLLELKHAQRILIEGNVIENSWTDSQTGYAVTFLSGGDSHPPGGLAQTADVTFRYNIVRNAPIAFNVSANPYQQATPVMRVAVEHNLFENIGPFGPNDSEARGIQLLDNLTHVRVAHNTLIRSAGGGSSFITSRDAGVPAASNITIVDNLAGVNRPYGVPLGDGIGTDALNKWAGTSWQFDHNVLWDSNVAPPDDARAPAGNFWPMTQADVGFAADWSLLSTSPYKGKASDGTDPGADMVRLRAMTAGVVQ